MVACVFVCLFVSRIIRKTCDDAVNMKQCMISMKMSIKILAKIDEV